MGKKTTLKHVNVNEERLPIEVLKISNSKEYKVEIKNDVFTISPTSYIYEYKVKERGCSNNLQVDFSDLLTKYPNHLNLINQMIVGLNINIKPDCSKKTIRDKVRGMKIFLEFLNSDNNMSNNVVNNVNDINIIVAKSFSNYILINYPTASSGRKWYRSVQGIVLGLQKLFPNEKTIGQSFIWPKGPGKKEDNNLGYSTNQIEELIDACIKDIAEIKRYHLKYSDLNEELMLEDWNLENLMYYFQEKTIKIDDENSKKVKVKKIIEGSGKINEFIKSWGYTSSQIIDLFFQKGSELASKGRNPYKTKINGRPKKDKADIQFNLAIATLKNQFPSFPYYMPVEEAKEILNSDNQHKFQKNEEKELLKNLINNAVFYSCRKITFFEGYLGKMGVYASNHFVVDTLYPFFLLIIINTGWNIETLLSITDDVDSHTTPDLIDPKNYILIHGKKRRGANDKEFLEVKYRSSKNKALDTYKLLKYVEAIVTKYKDSAYYLNGDLWQYTTPEYSKRVISSFNNLQSFNSVSKRFIKRHNLQYFSDSTGISHPKIRSGYVAIKQLLGSSELLISEELNHNDKNSIDYYISDESSNLIIDSKIKEIQNQLVDNLTNYKVRLIESVSLQSLRKSVNDAKNEEEKKKQIKKEAAKLDLEEKTIVHLLDVGAQKYILACEDSYKPTWPGCENRVVEGEKCNYFNKCGLCKQAIVFPEALPYIARRILDLEKMKTFLSSFEWIVNWGEEYESWTEILENWNNEAQVTKAWEMARMGYVALPKIMRGI